MSDNSGDFKSAAITPAETALRYTKGGEMNETVQSELKFGSQCEMILEAMLRGDVLTPLDALKRFGCFRLAARINDLKKEGWVIYQTPITRNGKHFASYSMEAK